MVMIIVLLMMMLKFIVFSDSRLVGIFYRCRLRKVDSSVSGIIVVMISVVWVLYRNSYSIRNISIVFFSRLWNMVFSVVEISYEWL